MLPLWKPLRTQIATTGVLNHIHRFSIFRNGSELLKMLPLWKRSCHESAESAGSP
jgi:hypothetical protein